MKVFGIILGVILAGVVFSTMAMEEAAKGHARTARNTKAHTERIRAAKEYVYRTDSLLDRKRTTPDSIRLLAY
jgi:hypothetical protein